MFSHEVTFYCDGCETNYLISEEMDMPPGWMGMQVLIADSDGSIPEHEREIFCHFCSQDCLIEFVASQEMRERLALADRSISEPPDFDEPSQ